uniref:prisilkin-39-like isoform X2 n=1 Tax=Scatophagus argus TaxID=75038 RepID=UPI001ED8224C|nr:prisilkin-39-like isoform X2 [Scatophagus argus]
MSRAMMGRLCEMALISLLIVFLLSTDSTWAKKGTGKKTSSFSNKGSTNSKPSSSKPQSPNRNTNPYPSGGSYPYPGTGNSNPGGYPRQNPGGYPNQNPGRASPGGYPNQNPAGGYPAAGGYPNQNPAGGYPAAGGYPNQNPGRGNYPNQYPPAGGYPAGGGHPQQYPAAGGYPAGGYPNQRSPYQYPAAGGYPVRGGSTGQGWGQPGAYPGGYPGGAVGGYPNWNPNNKILSPGYGGGGYGYGGYGHGMGGSAFSRSVQSMGYKPKSSGFAKKAMVAAGVGAVAGMAVGYGLGRFPRPHFSFRSPQEEYYYNNYMYHRYGTQSTDNKDFGRDYVYQPPPRAESFENFMGRCMNSTNLLKDQGSSSTTPKSQDGGDEEDDTVSIEEIGYPALIEQLKTRRCVEKYMEYSERFLQERKAEQQWQPRSRSSPLSFGMIQLITSFVILLSSMLLLQ